MTPSTTCVVRVGVSLLRRILGKAILVMSGRGRMMYQYLEPKPEGAICPKRSKPQGSIQLSSRHWCQYGEELATLNIQGGGDGRGEGESPAGGQGD